MDANGDPNRDLKHVIKFLFGKAPEPFWQLARVNSSKISNARIKMLHYPKMPVCMRNADDPNCVSFSAPI